MTTAILLNPWGLMSALALGVVLLIYLFYERHRPRRVSGLFLWDAPPASHRGGRRFDRLQASRSLLLDLLACLLLCVAFARPACTSRSGENLVIVLDGSLSMRAGGNHLKAREQAEDLLKSGGPSGKLVIVEAGASPRVLVNQSIDPAAAIPVLEDYDPFDTSADLLEALKTARELVSGQADIHIFTDFSITLPNLRATRTTLHVLPGREANVALLEALRRYPTFSSQETLSLVVKNFSDFETSPLLTIREGNKVVHESSLTLEPSGIGRKTLALEPGTGTLEVVVEADQDAISEDSRATLLSSPRLEASGRVELGDARTAKTVARALQAAGVVFRANNVAASVDEGRGEGKKTTVTILVTDNEAAREGAPANESGRAGEAPANESGRAGEAPANESGRAGEAPSDAGAGANEAKPMNEAATNGGGTKGSASSEDTPERGLCTLLLRPPGPEATALLGPYVIDGTARLCDQLDLTGVYWTADTEWRPETRGIPLVSVQDTVLYTETRPGEFILNLDPKRSNITRHAAWPVLFANLARHCEGLLPGLHRANYSSGELVSFVAPDDLDERPDQLTGEGIELPWPNLEVPLRLPVRPGLYHLDRGRETLAEVSVNAIAVRESDLSGLAEEATTLRQESAATFEGALHIKRWDYLLVLLALLTAFLNWWLDRRMETKYRYGI